MAQTSAQDQAIVRGSDQDRAHFLLLNIGHYLDHLFTLIFASAAVFALPCRGLLHSACSRSRLAGSQTNGAAMA
jgi:hypothetical protein